MDPNETLILALEALQAGEIEDAEQHLEALVGWLAKGGAAPKVEFVPMPGERRHGLALIGPDWKR